MPFRIASVAPIHQTTAEERTAALQTAGYNLYRLPSRLVSIDLLTDSGMVGLSEQQQARMFQADEAYAGSESYERLHTVVGELTGMPEIIPVPQGRAAEALLCHLAVSSGDVVPGNTYFNTT
ncbi:MAG: beta-eliminating lyase-related protein, partial [Solirubrobacterales bacterium]